MAYETTEVAVSKSQEQIKRLIYSHRGTGVNLMSQPPREGFEALVTMDKQAYHIRVMASCREIKNHTPQGKSRNASTMAQLRESEERRVWRVLYWHLKAMFEAADAGVIDVRNIIMPYVVLRDGMTLADHIRPKMVELMTADPSRLLTN